MPNQEKFQRYTKRNLTTAKKGSTESAHVTRAPFMCGLVDQMMTARQICDPQNVKLTVLRRFSQSLQVPTNFVWCHMVMHSCTTSGFDSRTVQLLKYSTCKKDRSCDPSFDSREFDGMLSKFPKPMRFLWSHTFEMFFTIVVEWIIAAPTRPLAYKYEQSRMFVSWHHLICISKGWKD